MSRSLPLALVIPALVVACSGDDTTTDSAGTTDSATTTTGSDTATTNTADSGTTGTDSGTTGTDSGTTDSGTTTDDFDGDGYTIDDGDCDDEDENVYPGAPEDLSDGVDQDCDELIDDASVLDLVAGDLVITEIMAQPLAGDPADGEWFEVVNASGLLVDLDGLTLSDADGNSWTVAETSGLPDGERVVFGASSETADNGGYTPDLVYSDLVLGDAEGTLSLSADGNELDSTSWSSDGTWPSTPGASLSLWGDATTATDNDSGTNWCDATSSYGDGDLGTPGSENDGCELLDDLDGDTFPGSEDCDDSDATVNPDATEVWYDGVDQDCSGGSDYDADLDGQDSADHEGDDCDDDDATVFDGAADTWYDGIDSDCAGDSDYDADADGEDSLAEGAGDDCDDTDASINTSAADTWYDGIDSDCAGDSDYDADVDGEDSLAEGAGDDCDDTDATINTSATEVWYDGVDQDCDSASDYDADGDTHLSEAEIAIGDDCDDTDASINPSATDTPDDGIDQDCDGSDSTEILDEDGDGHGTDTDCDDSDAAINTDATEVCDGVDNNCNGDVDDDDSGVDLSTGTTWYADSDADGEGDASGSGTRACDAPANTVADSSDCDDSDSAVNTSASEVCDGVDNDCNGDTDDSDSGLDASTTTAWYLDNDADSYYGPATEQNTCDAPSASHAAASDYTGEDCDDTDSAIHPAATEVCDGADNDCNGDVDDDDSGTDYSGEPTYYADSDGDGFGDDSDAGVQVCEQPSNTVTDNTDCDDTDASSFPGATETAGDGIDQDCDGSDLAPGTPLSDLGAGDLILTEIIQNPDAVSDANGEWFELYNASADEVNLDGLVIEDGTGSDSHTVSGNVLVAAGTYGVLCRNEDSATNGGVTCDYEYSGFTLGNGADEVVLSYHTVEFDRVEYDGGTAFPDPTGASMSLDSGVLSATDNDTGSNWCEATSTFGDGDYGTPGSANDSCGGGSTTYTYTWDDDISPLLQAECTGCHVGGASSGNANFDSYSTVVDFPSDDVPSMDLIEPSDATNSYLWHKLNDTQSTVGGGGGWMPKGTTTGLDKADLAMIETWISEGAPESQPSTTPTYTWDADISPLLQVECTGCHVGGASSGNANFDSYSTVVDFPSDDVPSMDLIEPSDATNSYLWHKLNDTQSTVGGGGGWMPKGTTTGLDKADLAMIETWISEGAAEN